MTKNETQQTENRHHLSYLHHQHTYSFEVILIFNPYIPWSRGSVLAFGTQVRGFKPGRSRRIFKGEKNLQHAFLRRGSKAVCPMSQICGM